MVDQVLAIEFVTDAVEDSPIQQKLGMIVHLRGSEYDALFEISRGEQLLLGEFGLALELDAFRQELLSGDGQAEREQGKGGEEQGNRMSHGAARVAISGMPCQSGEFRDQ